MLSLDLACTNTNDNSFGGRATFGQNLAGDGQDTDCSGHGTHVAGTTGSTTYGVAKNTELIAVKVLGCDGSGQSSSILSGIQWAANDTVTNGRVGKAVANMSLGGAFSQAVNDAVAAATQAGLFFAVAAGNEAEDASKASPASEPSACTVGATDVNDVFASVSNFGSALDILAPGVDILSTWNDGTSVRPRSSTIRSRGRGLTRDRKYFLALPWQARISLVWLRIF